MSKINLGNYIVPEETSNGLCIDVGANLGDFTDKYKNFFRKIIFIEPQIKLYESLCLKFKKYDHIIGINRAVWSVDNKILSLVNHLNDDSGSVAVKGDHINKDWTDKVINDIESISIESLISLSESGFIDYMKVDCETSEYELLYNKDLGCIKYIGIEIHPQMGLEKYINLVNWMEKTHSIINGDVSYTKNANKEVLFKLN